MNDAAALRQQLLGGARRLVVKLGSSLLAPEGVGLRAERLASLADQVAALRSRGARIVLVSSGAIASGMRLLKLRRRPAGLVEQQALAAVGQPELMRAYAEAFARHGLTVAQVLLTADDLNDRRRFVNTRKALAALLARGVVPIVNENDLVAIEDLRMGDNDLLSAQVAILAQADVLILLTDVDGLHTGRPGTPGAARLDVVPELTAEIRRFAGEGAGSEVGSGGMPTKLRAADQVTRAGHAALIARGADRDVLVRAVTGESVGTLFLPAGARMPAAKRWLAFNVRLKGAVHVDAGARAALLAKGVSLLPRGVVKVVGDFRRGAAVSVAGPDGQEFGRGVANYSAEELTAIRGLPARDIARTLGYTRGDEVIHRNRLVLLHQPA